MDWFNFLKSEGFLDPKQNPDPIQVKEGIQFPFWDVLSYLEKLSIQISQGEKTELIDELIYFIKNVSEYPKDNIRTWYFLLKFLNNIPNEKIPLYILDYIPVWLSEKFDSMMQTSELCEKLLPKFLNDQPTEEDIKKAEKILHYLFQVEKSEIQENNPIDHNTTYRSRIYLYFLADKFEKRNIIYKVVKYCSTKFILELGRTIKFLLLDFPNGINSIVKDGNTEYEIKINFDKENLIISSTNKDTQDEFKKSILLNWEDKTENEIKQELLLIFQQQNINYQPLDEERDTIKQLMYLIESDITSELGFYSIRKMGNQFSQLETILDVFGLIFRDLIDEKVKQDPKEGLKLLKKICFDKKYHLPFFIRISLYVISENWDVSKSLFFQLIQNNDELKLFSCYKYQKELFDLLNRIQHQLTIDEIKLLESILNQEEKTEDEYKEDPEYWQLRWYSALKEIDPFKEKYIELSTKLNITFEHFEKYGEIQVRYGSVSPISKDDLLNKSNYEIVDFIKKFNPKRHFDEPSVSGLSEIFAQAIEEDPEKFVSEIELYLSIPQTYYNHIFYALGNAWKNDKKFNWKKVLTFCLNIINNPTFYSEPPIYDNDELNTKPNYIIGSIGILLTSGLQNNENAIEVNLLPIVKIIIQSIVSNLLPFNNIKDANKTDYPTYSLNSTAGKSLRALLDYSLHRARNLFSIEENNKWEGDIKLLFEESLEKGIIDAYILEGMYFEQFYYLDKDWIIEQVEKMNIREEKQIIAFMGGFVFHNPPFNKDIYNIFYPLFDFIIQKNISFENFGVNGLVRHLTAFCFWNYENLSSQKLLYSFINNSDSKGIGDLIHYIWQQEKYPQSLNELELIEFQNNIFDLWNYLANKCENSTDEKEQENLANLSNWIVFFPELNEKITDLILKSCKNVNKIYSTHHLLKNLKKIIKSGNPLKNAIQLGRIISELNYTEYVGGSDKNLIRELVSFLFDYGQGDIANQFCNKMAIAYQDPFLRDLYDAYLNKKNNPILKNIKSL